MALISQITNEKKNDEIIVYNITIHSNIVISNGTISL